jgi:hypothetical protein
LLVEADFDSFFSFPSPDLQWSSCIGYRVDDVEIRGFIPTIYTSSTRQGMGKDSLGEEICFDFKTTFPAVVLPTLRKLYLVSGQAVLHLPGSF